MPKKRTPEQLARIKKKNEERAAAKAEFHRMLERLGPMNVRPYAIQDELGVPDSTLDNWKKEYIREKGAPDIATLGYEIRLQAQVALQQIALTSKKAEDPNLKHQATKDFLLVLDKYQKFLESWGFKEEVQQSIQEHQHKVEIETDKSKLLDMILTKPEQKKLAAKVLKEAIDS